MIRDKIDEFLLKLDLNNLIDIITKLKYRHWGGNRQTKYASDHSKTYRSYQGRKILDDNRRRFWKEFIADVVADKNKENSPTSRVSDKVADEETKGAPSGNSFYGLVGVTGVDDERSAFQLGIKIKSFLSEKR